MVVGTEGFTKKGSSLFTKKKAENDDERLPTGQRSSEVRSAIARKGIHEYMVARDGMCLTGGKEWEGGAGKERRSFQRKKEKKKRGSSSRPWGQWHRNFCFGPGISF